jgi:hypothetical protein
MKHNNSILSNEFFALESLVESLQERLFGTAMTITNDELDLTISDKKIVCSKLIDISSDLHFIGKTFHINKKQTNMKNSLDHLFGNLMGNVDELVKDGEKIIENEKLKTTKGTKKN